MSTDQELKDQWAKANRAGSSVNRKKAIASLASIGVTFIILAAGYIVLLELWPFDKVPVVMLALPWFGALPAGWWVRKKLAPTGALAG